MNKRIALIDVARSICIIWIVCFWHMNQYFKDGLEIFPSNTIIREYALTFTHGVLSLFSLISGYLMSQKKISTKKDIINYFKKRFQRFFIPLCVSCICLSTIGYINYTQIFTICFGVSQILSAPYPNTLWFFSMIILFYILTPIILLLKQKSIYITTYFCITIYFIFYIGNRLFYFDIRLIEYWPFYFIPLLYSQKVDCLVNYMKRVKIIVIITIALFILLKLQLIQNNIFQQLMLFFKSSIICLLLLSLSMYIEKIIFIKRFFQYISYASLFAYLFHREIYSVLYHIVGPYTYFYSVIFGVALFIMSYYMQLIYDKILKQFTN